MDRAPATALEESGRIQQLLDEVRELCPGPAWDRVEELVQRLLALQGEGLSRLLLHARSCGADGTLDAKIAGDELVSSLLLLYGLHPVPATQRVAQALEELRPRLAAHGVCAELISIEDGVARVRISGQSDGASAAVRRAVEDAAPELASVQIDEPSGPLVALHVAGAPP
jgi:Fe-S cluster biogenesis protein NfuA